MAKTATDPVAAAQRWAAGMAAAGPKITAGVNGVQTSPGHLAAAQKNVWLANVTASADRWAQSLQNMSLASWQQSMTQKGIPRIAQATTTAMPKVQAFLTQWIPFQAQVVAGLPPRGNLEANIQRSAELIRKNSAAKGKFRQSRSGA